MNPNRWRESFGKCRFIPHSIIPKGSSIVCVKWGSLASRVLSRSVAGRGKMQMRTPNQSSSSSSRLRASCPAPRKLTRRFLRDSSFLSSKTFCSDAVSIARFTSATHMCSLPSVFAKDSDTFMTFRICRPFMFDFFKNSISSNNSSLASALSNLLMNMPQILRREPVLKFLYSMGTPIRDRKAVSMVSIRLVVMIMMPSKYSSVRKKATAWN